MMRTVMFVKSHGGHAAGETVALSEQEALDCVVQGYAVPNADGLFTAKKAIGGAPENKAAAGTTVRKDE